MDVGHMRVEQAIEAAHQPHHFDAELIGPHDGAEDRGVQGRRIAAGSQDADASHQDSPVAVRWPTPVKRNDLGRLRLPSGTSSPVPCPLAVSRVQIHWAFDLANLSY